MQFGEISKEEFDLFAKNHPQKNFYQSLPMYEYYLEKGNECYLLGLKKDNTLVAATLLSIAGLGKRKTFESRKGYLVDYANLEILKEFNNNICKFAKEKGAFRVFIEPYAAVIQRDIDANIVENGFDNNNQVQNIKSLGFKPVDSGSGLKWTFVLNLENKTIDQIYNEFRQNTRNYINRTINKYKIKIKTLKYEELKDFKEIITNTCERRDFNDKPLEYFEAMYKHFKDKAIFKIAQLDCDEFIKTLEIENKDYETKMNNLSTSPANDGKRKNILNEIDNNKKKITEVQKLQKEKGNIISLSAAMFMLNGDEIIYLYSGSYKEYMHFFGQYALQWDIIQYAFKKNYKRYNFFGILDVFDKNGKDYGVYEFKKGFSGNVEELMDTYEIGISPYYIFYSFIRKIKNVVKKDR